MLSRRLLLNRSLLAGLALSTLLGGVTEAQDIAAKPLKILVYGGNGNIGSRIVAEAAARGHHVTVVERNPKEAGAASVKVIKGDVFHTEEVTKAIADQDVVVSAVAVRPTPTRDFYVRLVKSVVEAERSMKGHKPRFMIVGGASSLEIAPGKRLVDTLPPTLPDGVKNEILSMVDALDYLRTVKDVSWTFFSPAQNIAAGTRTGHFRIGGDQLIRDDKGESRISYEDYAVALLNEVEKPTYRNKRFTVGY